MMERRDLDVLNEVAEGDFAETAKQWISPFQGAGMRQLGIVPSM